MAIAAVLAVAIELPGTWERSWRAWRSRRRAISRRAKLDFRQIAVHSDLYRHRLPDQPGHIHSGIIDNFLLSLASSPPSSRGKWIMASSWVGTSITAG
jgi:hypothetical protein